MKKLFTSLAVAMLAFVGVSADKIETSFWNCPFGFSAEQVYNKLEEQELEPQVSDDAIILVDKDVYGVTFKQVNFKFTSVDAFYSLEGLNRYENKKDANNAYADALATIKAKYPNIQQISASGNIVKQYAYVDADSDEAFSLGLYKTNSGIFFVRLNILSNFLLKKSKE